MRLRNDIAIKSLVWGYECSYDELLQKTCRRWGFLSSFSWEHTIIRGSDTQPAYRNCPHPKGHPELLQNLHIGMSSPNCHFQSSCSIRSSKSALDIMSNRERVQRSSGVGVFHTGRDQKAPLLPQNKLFRQHVPGIFAGLSRPMGVQKVGAKKACETEEQRGQQSQY